MAEKYAVRNLRLCTKDCLCLYVCPSGATDTENSVIDPEGMVYSKMILPSEKVRSWSPDKNTACSPFCASERWIAIFNPTKVLPRMGKRVDAVVLYRNIVFLLEFKCGDTEYRQSTYDQVYDYALDLRNFQKESPPCYYWPLENEGSSHSANNIGDMQLCRILCYLSTSSGFIQFGCFMIAKR